jgi:two-component sensor histidine kinase
MHQSAEVRDVALLLTSELVTNTVRHGVGEAQLDIVVESNHATIGVTDRGDGQVTANHSRWPEGGHGLTLVDALSDRWGVEPMTGKSGKRVWFELTWNLAESA